VPIDPKLIDQLMAEYKKPEDIIGENGILKQLTKAVLERALQAEMTEHLGYEKHDPVGYNSGNSRNGKSQKKLKGEFGELELETPRDRNASFEPKIVAKGQTRFTGFDDKILSLYARGMTTREIQAHLQEIYGMEVSPMLISNVTEAVQDEVREWQNRPLEATYAIVYLDALYVRMRDNGHVQNRAVHVAIGVNLEGNKDVLGLWTSGHEGAKFWLQVLTELRNRGVEDIFIACGDGLKGFPAAIEAVYPRTQVQLCIVHLVRQSLNMFPGSSAGRWRATCGRSTVPLLRKRPRGSWTSLLLSGTRRIPPSARYGAATGSGSRPFLPFRVRSARSFIRPTLWSRCT
jgi:putative transposase